MNEQTTSRTFTQMAEQLLNMGANPSYAGEAKSCCNCGRGRQSTEERTAKYAKRFQQLGAQAQTLAHDFVSVATKQVRAGAQSILDATDPEKSKK